MEAEYDEVLHWEVPRPVEAGESSMAPETPWGEGIQLAGVIQPPGGDEVLHWEVPRPVEAGESSMAPETPWGEGIQLAGVIQPPGGEKANSIPDGR